MGAPHGIFAPLVQSEWDGMRGEHPSGGETANSSRAERDDISCFDTLDLVSNAESAETDGGPPGLSLGHSTTCSHEAYICHHVASNPTTQKTRCCQGSQLLASLTWHH